MNVKRIVIGAAILLVVVAGVMYVSGRREQPAPDQAAEQPVFLEFMTPT
jgi:Flp pilus assembly protein CpaB